MPKSILLKHPNGRKRIRVSKRVILNREIDKFAQNVSSTMYKNKYGGGVIDNDANITPLLATFKELFLGTFKEEEGGEEKEEGGEEEEGENTNITPLLAKFKELFLGTFKEKEKIEETEQTEQTEKEEEEEGENTNITPLLAKFKELFLGTFKDGKTVQPAQNQVQSSKNQASVIVNKQTNKTQTNKTQTNKTQTNKTQPVNRQPIVLSDLKSLSELSSSWTKSLNKLYTGFNKNKPNYKLYVPCKYGGNYILLDIFRVAKLQDNILLSEIINDVVLYSNFNLQSKKKDPLYPSNNNPILYPKSVLMFNRDMNLNINKNNSFKKVIENLKVNTISIFKSITKLQNDKNLQQITTSYITDVKQMLKSNMSLPSGSEIFHQNTIDVLYKVEYTPELYNNIGVFINKYNEYRTKINNYKQEYKRNTDECIKKFQEIIKKFYADTLVMIEKHFKDKVIDSSTTYIEIIKKTEKSDDEIKKLFKDTDKDKNFKLYTDIKTKNINNYYKDDGEVYTFVNNTFELKPNNIDTLFEINRLVCNDNIKYNIKYNIINDYNSIKNKSDQIVGELRRKINDITTINDKPVNSEKGLTIHESITHDLKIIEHRFKYTVNQSVDYSSLREYFRRGVALCKKYVLNRSGTNKRKRMKIYMKWIRRRRFKIYIAIYKDSDSRYCLDLDNKDSLNSCQKLPVTPSATSQTAGAGTATATGSAVGATATATAPATGAAASAPATGSAPPASGTAPSPGAPGAAASAPATGSAVGATATATAPATGAPGAPASAPATGSGAGAGAGAGVGAGAPAPAPITVGDIRGALLCNFKNSFLSLDDTHRIGSDIDGDGFIGQLNSFYKQAMPKNPFTKNKNLNMRLIGYNDIHKILAGTFNLKIPKLQMGGVRRRRLKRKPQKIVRPIKGTVKPKKRRLSKKLKRIKK
jgi:hypothetical protein